MVRVILSKYPNVMHEGKLFKGFYSVTCEDVNDKTKFLSWYFDTLKEAENKYNELFAA